MMSDDHPLDIKDQFAIAAMQSLIQSETSEYRVAQDYIVGKTSTLEGWQSEKMERIALAAYKMADAMRKARLKAFK
jgi:hypothetical protein